MTVPARHSNAKTSANCASNFDEDFAPVELYTGERICPPPAATGGNAMLRRGIVLLIALGGGWALLGNPGTWQGWLSAKIATTSPSMDRRAPGSVESAPSAGDPTVPPPITEPTTKLDAHDPPPSHVQPPASDTGDSPSAAVKSAASPPTTVAIVPAAEERPTPPLRPPTADHADPYQMRAAAVGLHPDLSRVLLTRLSPTDYRNAGIAIQTAVAKTPDTAVFVWPRQRKPELALFQVRFVPGAAPKCRRYVVTVTKDGWSTTAPPMEKCSSSPAGRRSE